MHKLIRHASFLDKYIKQLHSWNLESYLPRTITHSSMQLTADYDVESLTNGLSIPIWDMLDRGGKLWRGSLCLMTASLFAPPPKALVPLARALELIHNGSLMCDDIEDNSEKRRGKPCSHLLFGVDRALNAGNFSFFLPLRIISEADIPDSTKLMLYQDYTEEMIIIHMGQCTDMIWNNSGYIPSEEQYIRMVMNKTSVLARLAVKFALRFTKQRESEANALIKHAENIGVCFQIVDDVINLVSKEYAKERSYLGEDITEGKKTLIVIRAIQQEPVLGNRLKEILAMKTKDEVLVNEALEIIHKTDAVRYSKEYAARLMENSWRELGKHITWENEAKKDFYELMNLITNRMK
jgi:geranylgeranyl pyrophosphate synthase